MINDLASVLKRASILAFLASFMIGVSLFDFSIGTIIEVLSTILLAYVAYQNYKVNDLGKRLQEDKLRLDLFDKRHRIFALLQELLDKFSNSNTFTQSDIFEFANRSAESEFIFGDDVNSYIKEAREKGLRLIHLKRRLDSESIGSDGRVEIAKEIEELERWFHKQPLNSVEIFKKYLRFPNNLGSRQ
jgi:hypothetical protein